MKKILSRPWKKQRPPTMNHKCFFLLWAFFISNAFALDFQSIKENAPMYDNPNEESPKRYILKAFSPVEVISTWGEFAKVRDWEGFMAWVKMRHLSKTRTVVVLKDSFLYREPGGASHHLLAKVEKNVALFFVNNQNRLWIKVRDENGLSGFMHIANLWGV